MSACGKKPPLVQIHQLVINKADNTVSVNSFQVKKYNKDSCKMEVETIASAPLTSLHGGFCLSPEDFAKWKAYAQAECKNAQKDK
jgi:hypothetical protein